MSQRLDRQWKWQVILDKFSRERNTSFNGEEHQVKTLNASQNGFEALIRFLTTKMIILSVTPRYPSAERSGPEQSQLDFIVNTSCILIELLLDRHLRFFFKHFQESTNKINSLWTQFHWRFWIKWNFHSLKWARIIKRTTKWSDQTKRTLNLYVDF